ncbi:6-phosphofructokinase [Candidatus Bathyarchaeota archaeon]|nr:MAG: 6-phosphofructokinase [Candidatus Bathyarchaeota archaeon]
MKRIAIVTSGGDAPGMNAAIRAIVRTAYPKGIKIYGFRRGYEGLIEDNKVELAPRSVGGIIHLGGTILHTVRCPEFKTKTGLRKAAETLKKNKIDGLIVIGGNGSFKGAYELSQLSETAIIGVPATIDNDVYGTDETIGFDTAVNTAVSLIDKIRDTAVSHERVFIVEVMGRKRGFIALEVGLTVGAESILVPEIKIDMDKICDKIIENSRKGKRSNIIVAAEGVGITRKLAKYIEEKTKCEVRVTVLGHVQRGGHPTAKSRMLACLFGEKAVKMLLEEKRNKITAIKGNKITEADLKEAFEREKPLNLELLKLAEKLAI